MAFGERPSLEQCPVHEQERGVCRRLGYEQEGACQPNQPIDKIMSPAEGTAIQLHSIHQANISAGFTEAQSMYLLAVTMTGNPGIAPGVSTDPDGDG